VAWSPPPGVIGVVTYTVSVDSGNIVAQTLNPYITIAPLDNGTSYNYTITASTTAGEGPPARSGTVPSLKAVADGHMTTSLDDFLATRAGFPPPFDWTVDNCSVLPIDLRFEEPCQRHDFGYKNYGTGGAGLRLSPDEDTRRWIDDILLADMFAVCPDSPIEAAFICRAAALGVWGAVRLGGQSAFYPN
jgi:hypothetical protein